MAYQGADAEERPTVSVIVPTYKRPVGLMQALESILTQSHSNVEAVVVDDASPDETPRLLAEAQKRDSRVRWQRNRTNVGCAETRNTGIAMATGEYVAFLDDDDTYCTDKIARDMEVFAGNPGADVVVSGAPADACARQEADMHWIEWEFMPNKIFDSCYVVCRRAVLDQVRFRCNHMEWRDIAFQLYENGYRVRLTSENHVRKSKSEGSLSANEEAMLLGALENARTYEARTRGRDEHPIFKRYLANCQKNVANYCLKRGRLWRAVRGYRDAYRTGGRLKDLVPFARQDSGE